MTEQNRMEDDLVDKKEFDTKENAQNTPAADSAKRGGSRFGFLRRLFIYFAIFMFCSILTPKYLVERIEVKGKSMENTLHYYDNLLVEKVTYYFKEPDRFDIVTLYPNGRKGTSDGEKPEYYIKRIIGLPGEHIRIADSVIYINGKPLNEHFGKERLLEDGGIAEGDGITLGDDEFFVMGDNRNNSTDSRFDVGPVKKENIDGHAVLRICSFQNKYSRDAEDEVARGSISFAEFGTVQ